MRINIESDELIVASLPKVWANQLGLSGFFSKSKEGILVLTNKKIIFVPKWIFVSPRDRENYFGGNEVKITRMHGYSESELDEDISEQPKSFIIPLESIVNVENVEMRKANFLRITFRLDGRKKVYDFGIAKAVTSYPVRQVLQYLSIDWSPWVRVINAYL